MIGTQAAVVGTAILYGGVPMQRHLWWLEEDLAAAATVIHIVGHEHTLKAVLRTPLQHEDGIVLENDFGVYAAKARSTEGDSGVVEEVRPGGRGHRRLPFPISIFTNAVMQETTNTTNDIRQIKAPRPERVPPNGTPPLATK
jgi:hypothetical protein